MKKIFIFVLIIFSCYASKSQTSEIWRQRFTLVLQKKDSICFVETFIMNKEHILYDTLHRVKGNIYVGKKVSLLINRNKHHLKIHGWPFKQKLQKANAADIIHLNYNRNYILRRNNRQRKT